MHLSSWFFRLVALLAASVSISVSAQTTGGLDVTFQFSPGGTPAGASGYSLADEGKVIVVGPFTSYHGIARKSLARLQSDGSLDPAFDPGAGPGEVVVPIPGGNPFRTPGSVAHALALPGGKVLVAGAFSSWGGVETRNLARLLASGAVDPGFISSLPGSGALTLLPDGKVLMAGKAGDFANGRKIGLGRLNADGTLDSGFADAGVGAFAGLDFDAVTIAQVARDSEGKLVVIFAGLKSGGPAYGVARLQPDGAIDTTFVPALTSGFTSVLSAVAVDSSGRVLVAGTATTYGGKAVGKVFRLTATGAVDDSFVFAVPASVISGLVTLPEGTALVTGTFTGIPGPVVRIQADGARDATFGFTQSGTFGTLFVAIASQPKVSADGRAYLNAGVLMIQSGGQIVQGNGPIRLTGSGGGGGTVTKPSITTAPKPATAAVGSAVAFSVVAEGTAPLSYQWSRNGTLVAGATSATLTLASVSEADAGEYRVSVSNLGGTVESAPVQLTVTRPPRFTALPASPVVVAQGGTVVLTAAAEGPGTLQYQWYRAGQPLAGATQATLTLADVQAATEGLYEIEVTSEYGSVRSPGLQVVLAVSKATWFVASQTDGPGQITDLWLDGVRGVLVAGTYGPAAAGAPEFTLGGITLPRPVTLNGFVARLDDAGAVQWVVPIVGDLSHGLRVATYVSVAATAEGQVYLSGPMRGTGSLSGLSLGAVGGEGTFVARLDASGKGLWSQFITGNLYERQLAVDGSGRAVLTGRYTSDLRVLSTQLPAVAFGAAAVFQFATDGTVRWARHFQKADTVGGTVDAYNVTADAEGIYIAGTYDQSIRFGAFTERLLAPPFRAVGWLGRLDLDGNPVWLRAIGGSLPRDIARGPDGALWIVGQDDPPGGQVLHGYRTDGGFVFRGVVARSGGTAASALAAGVGVDSSGRPLVGGHAQGIVTVGGLALGIGQNPQGLWTAAATPAGAVGNDALLTAFLTVPPSGALTADEFEASPAASLYYAGSWTGLINVNGGRATNVLRQVFVAKVQGVPLPSRPAIVRSPTSQLYALGENRTLSCTATGGGLTFRWLKNGVPIPETNLQVTSAPGVRPGESASVLTFLGLTDANAGTYTCEVSNALGSAVSESAVFKAGTRPLIVAPPQVQRVAPGAPITLKVEATGGDLQYEWARNGVPVPGGPHGAVLTLPAATALDAGLYTVSVFNGLGSVISRPARVIVCSELPESTFLGRTWVRVFDDAEQLPGTTTLFGPWARDDRPRFTLKDRTVHVVASAGGSGSPLTPVPRALLRWRAGTLETLVWTNRVLADGDRFTDCFYPTDETDGAMNFTGFTVDSNGRPRAGLFELRSGTITRRVDDRTPLPGGAGTFLTFGSNVRRGNTLIGYPGTQGDATGASSGVYAVGPATLAPLIAVSTALPSPVVTHLGGIPSPFGLGFDGVQVVVAAADASGLARQAVFVSDLSGTVRRLAQTGDAVPGQAGQVFRTFGAADVAGGAAYFIGVSDAGVAWVVRAKEGQLTVLGAASALSAGGADQVYTDAGPALVTRFTGASETPEVVLPQNAVLDCRRVVRVWQVDGEGEDVVVGVDFADGSSGVYANVSAGGGTGGGPRLLAPVWSAGRVNFGVATTEGKTYRVERQDRLGASVWTPLTVIAGDGTTRAVTVETSGTAGFVRVVQE